MRIPFRLVVLAVPLAEIVTFLLVATVIGFAAAFGRTLLASLAGVVLLRWHGIATLASLRSGLSKGGRPPRSISKSAGLSVAALLLIIPGFLTDLLGIALFVPAVRKGVWRLISRRFKVAGAVGGRQRQQGSVVDLDPTEFTHTSRSSPWSQRIDAG
jgi:UPF0716 protein FxsA